MNGIVFFQRHGEADKAKDGQKDLERNLNEAGVAQAESLGQRIKTAIDLKITSTAFRAQQTATETYNSNRQVNNGGYTTQTFCRPELYPDPDVFPEIDRVFKILKQTPLTSYLLIPSTAQEFEVYAKEGWKQISEIIQEVKKDGTNPVCILVTTHAVCTNALVREMQIRFGSTVEDMVMVGNMNVAPGAGFMVELEDDKITKITYIEP